MGSPQRLQAVLPGALDLDGPTEPPHWDRGAFLPVIDLSLGVAALEREDLVEGGAVYGPGQPPEGTPVLVRGDRSQTLRHVKALCPGRRRGVWGPQPGLALAWPVLVPLPFFSEAVGPEGM